MVLAFSYFIYFFFLPLNPLLLFSSPPLMIVYIFVQTNNINPSILETVAKSNVRMVWANMRVYVTYAPTKCVHIIHVRVCLMLPGIWKIICRKSGDKMKRVSFPFVPKSTTTSSKKSTVFVIRAEKEVWIREN